MEKRLKKVLKVLCINFVVLACLLFCLEVFLLIMMLIKYDFLSNILHTGDSIIDALNVRMFNEDDFDRYYKAPFISKSDYKTIIVFGCSFAFGDNLGEDEDFSSQLYRNTNFSVHNRADSGFGPQMMLYQLQKDNSSFLKKLIPNAEYIVYVFIGGHLQRVVMSRCFPFLYKVSPKYKLSSNNKLIFQPAPKLLAYSNIYRYIESLFPKIKGEEYCKKLFIKIMEESYKKSQELYPGVKFYTLVYDDMDNDIRRKLEAIGIKVIYLHDLSNENFQSLKYQISEYDTHPNAEAWRVITPLFIKKAGIN